MRQAEAFCRSLDLLVEVGLSATKTRGRSRAASPVETLASGPPRGWS